MKLTPPAASLAALALALAAAGCSAAASSSTPAPAAPAASTAPGTATAAAATVTPAAACKALAAWENSGSGSVAKDTSLKAEFEGTSEPLSGDFATWTSDILAGSPDVSTDADAVAADCASLGVTVFPPVSPSAAPTAPASPAQETVTFKVSGSPAQVTYGPAGSNTSGTVPMKVTEKLGNPLYYAVTAQLQGSGSVSCEIDVDGKAVSKATASGGFQIAQCEVVQDIVNGGWQDANKA